MQLKETVFDFSKKNKEVKKIEGINWSLILKNVGLSVKNLAIKYKRALPFLVCFTILTSIAHYLFTDSPEEYKTKVISMQIAYANIPEMLIYLDENKNKYNNVVGYLSAKEYEIKTNKMNTINQHVNNLKDANINFKKRINESQESLNIINKKLKSTGSFNSLTWHEKSLLLDEYKKYQSNYEYQSEDMIYYINRYTTTKADDTDLVEEEAVKSKLYAQRQEIKDNVAVILKNQLKK